MATEADLGVIEAMAAIIDQMRAAGHDMTPAEWDTPLPKWRRQGRCLIAACTRCAYMPAAGLHQGRIWTIPANGYMPTCPPARE